MGDIFANIGKFLENTGVAKLFVGEGWKTLIMYAIVMVLFYLAIVKKFEPMLLLPIAFGMLLANLPGAELYHSEFFFDEFYASFSKEVFGKTTVFQVGGAYASEVQSFLTEIIEEFGGTYNPQTLSYTDALGNVVAFWQDGALYFSESFKTADGSLVYTIKDGICNLNKAVLVDAQGELLPSIQSILKSSVGDIAKLKFSGENAFIQIKMSTVLKHVFNEGGLLDMLYLGVKFGIYPSLIFLGTGAMTDFSPLIANPKSLLLGAAAQFGVFAAFFFAILFNFSPAEAAAIGIIGGADGPTAILVTKTLAPHLLGAIAIAAYSYMALIPMIQPPFMKLLTTKKERSIVMTGLRPVSKAERVIFPILVALLVVLIVPDAAPLVGFLMLGNLFNVSGVTDRLSKTVQNELINIVTIFLGVSVGATAKAENFLATETILIIMLGLFAFTLSTCGGLLFGKLMCFLTKGKINPLIGSAGVSAVPMAARVAQDVGRKENPSNFLLMHAMGPNVAGVIGSAVAAGVFLTWFA